MHTREWLWMVTSTAGWVAAGYCFQRMCHYKAACLRATGRYQDYAQYMDRFEPCGVPDTAFRPALSGELDCRDCGASAGEPCRKRTPCKDEGRAKV